MTMLGSRLPPGLIEPIYYLLVLYREREPASREMREARRAREGVGAVCGWGDLQARSRLQTTRASCGITHSPCTKPPIHEREPRAARREEARRVRGGSGKLRRLAGSCEQRRASSGKASSRSWSVVPLRGCASHEQLVRLAVDVRGAAASSSEHEYGRAHQNRGEQSPVPSNFILVGHAGA
jgi:hypothetical protein